MRDVKRRVAPPVIHRQCRVQACQYGAERTESANRVLRWRRLPREREEGEDDGRYENGGGDCGTAPLVARQ